MAGKSVWIVYLHSWGLGLLPHHRNSHCSFCSLASWLQNTLHLLLNSVAFGVWSLTILMKLVWIQYAYVDHFSRGGEPHFWLPVLVQMNQFLNFLWRLYFYGSSHAHSTSADLWVGFWRDVVHAWSEFGSSGAPVMWNRAELSQQQSPQDWGVTSLAGKC